MRPLARAVVLAAALLIPAAAPALAAACDHADGSPRAAGPAAARSATLCLLNEERAQRGLSPLRPEPHLQKAAQRYARTMAARRFFSHVSAVDRSTPHQRLRRAGYGGRRTGENIAFGTLSGATPENTMERWMLSPGHKANILNARYTHVGIGVGLRRTGEVFYTTNFGAAR